MKFIGLTDLGGNKVWVATAWIQFVRAPFDREFSLNAKTVLVLSGASVAVQETIEQVHELLDGTLSA